MRVAVVVVSFCSDSSVFFFCFLVHQFLPMLRIFESHQSENTQDKQISCGFSATFTGALFLSSKSPSVEEAQDGQQPAKDKYFDLFLFSFWVSERYELMNYDFFGFVSFSAVFRCCMLAQLSYASL